MLPNATECTSCHMLASATGPCALCESETVPVVMSTEPFDGGEWREDAGHYVYRA